MTHSCRLILFVLASTIAVLTAVTPFLAEEPPGKMEPEMAITATLDKTDVFVGDKVTLTETVPDTLATSVTSIGHSSAFIGDWDKTAKKIRSLELADFRYCSASRVFELSTTLFSHPNDFEGPSPPYVRQKDVKGITFTFKPQKPGMFLLSTRWENRDSAQVLTSNAVVLIVRER